MAGRNAPNVVAVAHLSQAAQLLSPTDEAKNGFYIMEDEMVAARESKLDIAKAYVGALGDGLRHGNWPNPKGRAPVPAIQHRDAQNSIPLLLQAAVHLSPTGVEQEAFGDLVNRMRGAGCAESSIVIELASAIFAGVANGNWPVNHNTHKVEN